MLTAGLVAATAFGSEHVAARPEAMRIRDHAEAAVVSEHNRGVGRRGAGRDDDGTWRKRRGRTGCVASTVLPLAPSMRRLAPVPAQGVSWPGRAASNRGDLEQE